MNVVNQPIVKHKLGLLNLAEELGNVSQACKIMGVSRDNITGHPLSELSYIRDEGCPRMLCSLFSRWNNVA